MTIKRTALTATATALLTALAGCGGDDGSSSSGTTETTTVSGTVQSPDGESIGYNNWIDYGQQKLAQLVSGARADISGIADVPEGTPVQLVRLNTDGSVAETLASTSTDSNGEFSFSVDASTDLSGDTVVQAGTNDSTIRAPAAGENLDVNPVSEKVVRDLVNNGNVGLNDVEPEEVEATVEVVEEELESQNVDLSGSSSVDDAVSTVDSNDGSTSEDLLEASASDAGADFVGDKNVTALDFQVTESDTSSTLYEAALRRYEGSITESGAFDRSGESSTRQLLQRTWTESNGSVTDSFNADTVTESLGSSSAITFEGNGRFVATLQETPDALTKGIRTDDGEIFAGIQTDSTGTSSVFAGANDWSPSGGFSETYNIIRMDSYLAETDSTGGQVGLAPMLRAEASFDCSGGTCTIDVTREPGGTANARKYFLQQGIGSSLFADPSNILGTFTLDQINLASDGKLEGPDSTSVENNVGIGEVNTSGFVGPDGRIATFMITIQDTNETNFPSVDYYVGVPQGTSCTDTTLDGTYNVVGMNGTMIPATNGSSPAGELDMEFERYEIQADGAGGLTRAAGTAKKTKLVPFSELPSLSQEVRTNQETLSGYSVESNCVVRIEDQTGNRRIGAVSPDGEILVLGTFTENEQSGGQSGSEITEGSSSGGFSIAIRTGSN